jgi:hypothetical protein
MKAGGILQESGNLSLKYCKLLPIDTTSNGPSVVAASVLHLWFAQIFLPLSITESPLPSGCTLFLFLL